MARITSTVRVKDIQAIVADPKRGIISLVGDNGGLSLITGEIEMSSVHLEMIRIETEHGTVYLEPNLEVEISEEVADAPNGGLGLTVAEAAERIGYGVSTVRRHIQNGNIPAVKAKGRIYIRVDDIDAFAAPRSIRTTDESLQAWAKRIAATAPPFTPEQRQIILSAFATTLDPSPATAE